MTRPRVRDRAWTVVFFAAVALYIIAVPGVVVWMLWRGLR